MWLGGGPTRGSVWVRALGSGWRRVRLGVIVRWQAARIDRDLAAGVTRQSLTCAAILAGSVIAQLEGHHWAAVLTASSTLTLAALTVLLLILK